MIIIYFIIVSISNFIGSLSGMGGGLFIKPLINITSNYPLLMVIFYSNISILTMCISSLINNYRVREINFKNYQIIHIAFGSLIGGFISSILLNYLAEQFKYFKQIQIILTILIIVMAIIYQIKGKPINKIWSSSIQYLLLGIIFGFISIILGIGGGPINVFLLMFLTGCKLKTATIYSLVSVFTSMIIRMLMSYSIIFKFQVDYKIILIFILASIIGGTIGSKVKRYISSNLLKKLYISTLIMAFVINFINLWV